MLKTLLGPEQFRAGMDLYFARHDGEAATVEQFVQCFADASGRDLTQFMRWYSQAGTPEVVATAPLRCEGQDLPARHRAERRRRRPASRSRSRWSSRSRSACVGRDGRDLPLRSATARIERGVLVSTKPARDLRVQGYCRAAGALAQSRLLGADQARRQSLRRRPAFRSRRATAIRSTAGRRCSRSRPSFSSTMSRGCAPARTRRSTRASSMRWPRSSPTGSSSRPSLRRRWMPPSEADIAREIGHDVDPDAIFRARAASARRRSADICVPRWSQTYRRMMSLAARPIAQTPSSAGRRALKNICLDLLAATRRRQRHRARGAAVPGGRQHDRPHGGARDALAARRAGARRRRSTISIGAIEHDPLVIDKWLALQAMIPEPATLDRVRALTAHPAFSMANPNRVRSLIGSFAQGNATQFNRADGAGYDFVGRDRARARRQEPAGRRAPALRLQELARARSRPPRQSRSGAAPRRRAKPLSRDVGDIVQRTLAEA